MSKLRPPCKVCGGHGLVRVPWFEVPGEQFQVVQCIACAGSGKGMVGDSEITAANFFDTNLADIEATFLPAGKTITDLPLQNSIDGIPCGDEK